MTEARFTQGSTMRHVSVMTATGAVGLMALFLVDAANLFYISLLGERELAAAIGFAGTVQFLMISVSIGLSIGATALVSRAVGAGQRERARRLAGSSMVTLVTALGIAAAGVWLARDWVLDLLGATGETHEIASRFLAIVLPGMPLLGIGMVSSGLLRAVGDARRAMWVTLGGGMIAAALDPLFIFALGLGIDGAAIVSLISRASVAAIGLWSAARVHAMVARPRALHVVEDSRGLFSIAGPGVATQVSTPFGMAYLTALMAEHGDSAVAGWAVVGRITALAFGGIFALSGAVGPILGQNLGAERLDRVRAAYRDALIFAALYVAVVWLVLAVGTEAVIAAFGLAGAGAEVFRTFAHFGAGAYLFTAALFVSNAAFNNLGRPLRSTMFNWSRDALAIPGLAALAGAGLTAEGVVLVQAVAAMIVGTGAALAAWAYVRGLERGARAEAAVAAPPSPPFASRAAMAAVEESARPPLAERDERR